MPPDSHPRQSDYAIRPRGNSRDFWDWLDWIEAGAIWDGTL